MNQTDVIRLDPEFRSFSEVYEPALWTAVMANVKPDSIVADVGAFIGFYALAIGRRLSPGKGLVYAFEPDASNYNHLKYHIKLNHVEDRVRAFKYAVGSKVGKISFIHKGSSVSKAGVSEDSVEVTCTTLDNFLPDKKVDMIIMDVEGLEDAVLEGATGFLSHPAHSPSHIFIETHPYAWDDRGAVSEKILGLLRQSGYEVFNLKDMSRVEVIKEYGHIWAKKIPIDISHQKPLQASG